MSDYYILDGHETKKCNDVIEWGKWFQKNDKNRHVGYDKFGDVRVSTVFLGLNHNWGGDILLFETMIFGGEHDEDQWRYSTWEEAEIGHKEAVKLVQS